MKGNLVEKSNLPSPVVYLPAYRYPTFAEMASKILQQMDDEYKSSMKRLGELQSFYPAIRDVIEKEKLPFPVDLTSTKQSILCTITLSNKDHLDSLHPLVRKLNNILSAVSWSADSYYGVHEASITLCFRPKQFTPVVLSLKIKFPPSGLPDVETRHEERVSHYTATTYRFNCPMLEETLGELR